MSQAKSAEKVVQGSSPYGQIIRMYSCRPASGHRPSLNRPVWAADSEDVL